jgi:ethylbenzene dioxygenase ferredoxin component
MEAFAMTDNGLNVVRVCARADVPPGTVRAFAVGANTLAVYNIDGAYYVTDDECTHAAASLADGLLDGDVIECCMHMGSFHVPTGNVVAPPCEEFRIFVRTIATGEVIKASLAEQMSLSNAFGTPARLPLRTYKVVLEGDDVFADLARNAADEPQ